MASAEVWSTTIQPVAMAVILLSGRDPFGGRAEGGFGGVDPLQRRGRGVGSDGQQAFAVHLPASDFHSPEGNHVFARLKADVVGDVHRGHHKAQLYRQMAAQGANAGKQLAALLFIHQRHQGITDLQAEFVHAD